MKVHKDWIGSRKAATKGDLADLQEDIHVDLQQFATKQDLKDELEKYATKADLEKVAQGLMSKETGEELLGYMKSIDRELKRQRDIPEDIERLKTRVLKL